MSFDFPEDKFPSPKLVWLGAAESARSMPFDFNRESRLILRGEVEGRTSTLLLDSGMEVSAISRDLFSRLNRKSAGTLPVIDRSALQKAQIVPGVEIILPMVRIRDLTVAVMDLDFLCSMIGLRIDGVLGREIFEAAFVDIDFPRRQIALAPAGTAFHSVGSAVTPLCRFKAGRGRTIAVSLEHGPPVELEFDLGSANPLVLQSGYWQPNGLHLGRPLSNSLVGGANGIRETGLISMKEVTFAGFTLAGVDALLEQPTPGFDHRLGHGTIGMPILSKFRIGADYTKNILHVSSPSSDGRISIPRNRSGLRVLQQGQCLKVLLVARDSPAAKGNWQQGDMVRLVNGRPIDDTYWSSGFWRWSEADVGTEVRLTMANGETRYLILADYY
jgi:hypothetical protein